MIIKGIDEKEYDELKFDFDDGKVTTKINFKSEGWGIHIGPRYEKRFIYEYEGIRGTYQHDGAFLSHFLSLDEELLIPDLTEKERLNIPKVDEQMMWTPKCNWHGFSLPDDQHRFEKQDEEIILQGDRFTVLRWYRENK